MTLVHIFKQTNPSSMSQLAFPMMRQ